MTNPVLQPEQLSACPTTKGRAFAARPPVTVATLPVHVAACEAGKACPAAPVPSSRQGAAEKRSYHIRARPPSRDQSSDCWRWATEAGDSGNLSRPPPIAAAQRRPVTPRSSEAILSNRKLCPSGATVPLRSALHRSFLIRAAVNGVAADLDICVLERRRRCMLRGSQLD